MFHEKLNRKEVFFPCNSSKLIVPWGEDGAIAATTDGNVYTANIYPIEKVKDTLGAGTYNLHSSYY